jgi:hypothetical protein
VIWVQATLTSGATRDTIEVCEQRGRKRSQEHTMKTRIALAATLLTAGLLSGLIAGTVSGTAPAALADGPTSTAVDPTNPISAETGAPSGDAKYGADPLLPYGTDPQFPVTPGYVNRNHDEGITSNGEVDMPF